MDLFFDLPTSGRHNGVLAVSNTITAEKAAKLYLDNVFCSYGFPKSIVSDLDPRFAAGFWNSLFDLLDTDLHFATKDHPESDGQSERAICELEILIKIYCQSNQWSQYLSLLELFL